MLANALAIKLSELQNRSITIIDADIIRIYLSSEPGFSKEHRSINIRRVGFIANEITKNGSIAICAQIAILPFNQDRKYNREFINKSCYIEIHVSILPEIKV